MDKNGEKNYNTLTNAEIYDTTKNEYLTVANGSISISKEINNNKKPKCIINNSKKIIRKTLLIPNSKCQFKKVDNNNSIRQKKINMNKEKSFSLNKIIKIPDLKRHNSGYVQRKKNCQLLESKPRKNTSNTTVFNNIEQQKTKIVKTSRNFSNKENNKKKLIQQKEKKIYSLKNNNLKNINSVKNYNNIGIKIIQNNGNGRNNGNCPKFITKIVYRTNAVNEKLNTTTYNNNININLNNNYNSNNNNNKDNQIIFGNPTKTIFFNKNDINDDIKKKIHIRSSSYNMTKIKDSISPIKVKNIHYENKNNDNNKKIKIPFTQIDMSNSHKVLPNNYNYHEITHFSSSKKNTNYNNINIPEEQYINKNNNNNNNENGYYIIKSKEQYSIGNNEDNCNYNYNNYNCGEMSNSQLIGNQSFSHFFKRPPLYDFQIPHFSTFYNNKKRPLKKNINENHYYKNIYLCKHNTNNNNYNEKLSLPIQLSKQKYNDEYIKSINANKSISNEDISEKQQTIHYFGEQMLERNKNYYLSKFNNSVKNLNYYYNNDNSNAFNNKINQKNFGGNDLVMESPEMEKTSKIEENTKNGIQYAPNTIKIDDYNKKKTNNKNARYAHNIVSRKRKKKLVMEKRHNVEFIKQSNKKNNIKNQKSNTRDKIGYYDSSIIDLDTDSINEIIKEFEKEIEDEERKENDKKINNHKIINISLNNESNKYSFFSDNDYSVMSMSKDSTNISKINKRKIYYFKTKNIDMEKNYDFTIYGIKKNKSLKK